jgi:drug/metabolite transporter (DMT)-like permease
MNPVLFDYVGELAALIAASLWAASSAVYGRLGAQIAPSVLNFVKGVVAIALLVLTLLLRNEFFVSLNSTAVLLLLLSGVVGIGLGDTAYFAALNCLGARRVLLMEALAPPIAALLALIFLQEVLSLQAWIGIGLTIAGVAWVITERTAAPVTIDFRPWRGISFGILAALGQASGAVMSRAALAGTDTSPLWSTLLRLTAGVGMILILIAFQPGRDRSFAPLRSPRLIGIIAVTAFFSTYLAIWLQQVSLKFAATGIAQALSSTSPLFILPIAAAMGEKISPRAVLGVVIALAGVWLLLSGR